MKHLAYRMIEFPSDREAIQVLNLGLIYVSGKDAVRFLQGQLTNDVYAAAPQSPQHTALLNNTGHLLADICLVKLDDRVLLMTDLERVGVLRRSLERFVVRERVEFANGSEDFLVIRLNSKRASEIETLIFLGPDGTQGRLLGRSESEVEFLWPTDSLISLLSLMKDTGLTVLSTEQTEIVRVEQGLPKWGAELDETVIPLEAGFADAISYTKGCYMGQEIIARIHSRGHTNRRMVGLRLGEMDYEVGTALIAADGERKTSVVGKLTSITRSESFGNIGIGFVRNEYAALGTTLLADDLGVHVADLPFGVE